MQLQLLRTSAIDARLPLREDEVDRESDDWLAALRADGRVRDEAIARLHELLLKAARFEVARRRGRLAHLRADALEDIALQSADDALVAVLAKLDDFRGASRFTTWAYKFALLEAAVALRRRAWQNREIPLTDEGWSVIADAARSPGSSAHDRELLGAVRDAIRTELTARQREVLVAVTLNDVPIDVLAERLATTRGALYKTLHDARRKLRAALARQGYDHPAIGGGRRP